MASSYQNDTSTMIDKERKALELMKKKQQQDIEQMMEYEMKMQLIRKKNEEKLVKQKERDMAMQDEIAWKK